MYAIIGTWKMCYDGLTAGHALLAAGGTAADAVEKAITMVEDNPAYSSVGYGGLPARERYETRSCHLTAMRLAAPVSDPTAFLNVLRQLEDRPRGAFSACQAELVYHDWYDARKHTLASFPMHPQ